MSSDTETKVKTLRTIPKKTMGYLIFANHIINNSNVFNELLSSDINNIVEYVNNISNNKNLSNEIVDMRNTLMGKPKRKPRATKAKTPDSPENTIVNELVALARDENNPNDTQNNENNEIENVIVNTILKNEIEVKPVPIIKNDKEEQKRLKEEQKKEKEEQKRLKEEQKKEKEEQKRLKEEQKKEKEEQKRLKEEQKQLETEQ